MTKITIIELKKVTKGAIIGDTPDGEQLTLRLTGFPHALETLLTHTAAMENSGLAEKGWVLVVGPRNFYDKPTYTIVEVRGNLDDFKNLLVILLEHTEPERIESPWPTFRGVSEAVIKAYTNPFKHD